MNERDFFYWLQGFFELAGTNTLSEKQVEMIKEHMTLVAEKKTPTSMSNINQKPFQIGIICDCTMGCKKCGRSAEDCMPIINVPTCLTC